MKRGGKRRESMGWDLACPSSRERGMTGDVRVPRATNGGFYCGEMLSPGMKWVLPPVDSLVGFHGASNIVGGDGASS
jgi:hypothetical protein